MFQVVSSTFRLAVKTKIPFPSVPISFDPFPRLNVNLMLWSFSGPDLVFVCGHGAIVLE